ncbi:expressed protein [Phakopsora pachyrhizi]|uniref:Expressed protein n=1 Tax=Phakopsora pachyrhizi TaxID=170000 RepID=A0AAV0B6I2_PHAPC|nr:expressed protein [Phakopsora pachyrhizi]
MRKRRRRLQKKWKIVSSPVAKSTKQSHSFFLNSRFSKAKNRNLEESSMELITKLHNIRQEFQNINNEEVYSNFQSLIESLKHYQSKDLSRLGLNDESSLLSRNELGNLILKDFKKIFEHIFQNLSHDFKIENSPEIPIVLHIIDWLALSELDKNNLLPNLLKNEKVIEVADRYISSQIIHKRGYIEIFKTDEIQDHLLNHQDLGDIRNLLICLKKNHWRKLELGFIRAHMNSLFKMKNIRADFEEILKAMEEAPSFNPNWLKVLNMDSVEKDVPAFFGEKVLVLHALNYCRKNYENFKLEEPIKKKVIFFNSCFNLFRKQLIVLLDMNELGDPSMVDIAINFPVMHYVLNLKSSAMRNTLQGGYGNKSAQIVRNLGRYKDLRFLTQYKDLEISFNNFFYSHSLIDTFHENDELISWERNTPMNRLCIELFAIHEIYKSMESDIKLEA